MDHDTLITSTIHNADSDPKSLTTFTIGLATLEGTGTWSTIALPGGTDHQDQAQIRRHREARLVTHGITQVYSQHTRPSPKWRAFVRS